MRVLTVAMLLASAAIGSLVGAPRADALSVSDKVTASGYDPKIAMDALFYSKAVTCDAADIASWTCDSCGFNPGMKSVSVFTDRDTQAYVGYDVPKGNIVVAIRGSANIQNWLDDFTFEKVPYPACYSQDNCMVHKGFYEVYTALSGNMIPAVKGLLATYPKAPLFVTGHSLGAAISILAALDLYLVTGDRTVNVYNFGEPRVGDGNFTQFAASKLPSKSQFRVTHHEDPVPHVPPMDFGFIHIPHEIFYDNDGNTTYIDCNDSVLAEDPTCSDKYNLIEDLLNAKDHTHYLGVHTGCSVTADALAVRAHTQL